MSLNSITTSLISMQNSLKSASSLASAKTELKTEASIYAPSVAYKGDPKKAAALNDKANGVDSTIGNLMDNVQKKITDLNNQNANSANGTSPTDQSQTNGSDTAQATDQSDDTSSAAATQGAVTQGINVSVQPNASTESGKAPALKGSFGPIGGNLDVIA